MSDTRRRIVVTVHPVGPQTQKQMVAWLFCYGRNAS